jgi:hypothetical protein
MLDYEIYQTLKIKGKKKDLQAREPRNNNNLFPRLHGNYLLEKVTKMRKIS